MRKLAITQDNEVLFLNVARQSDAQAPLVAREPIRYSDILPMRDETWLQGVRRGKLPLDLATVQVALSAARQGGSVMLTGVLVQVGGNGHRSRRVFPAQCFDQTLARALAEPLENGSLQLEDNVRYWLSAEPATADGDALPADGDHTRVRVSEATWHAEPARLADYLAASEQLIAGAASEQSSSDEDRKLHPPLFVPADVWQQGRQFACRHENLESAAIFTGRLMRDTATAELFVVVDACIEAAHAEEEKYSVMLTAETWAEVRRVLELRRQRLGRPHEIIVGSVHGHPFLPAGDEKGDRLCPTCPQRATCTKTTAIASSDDIAWHRSVFVGQPWASLMIWGFNAREEEVWQAYGLGGGTLVPRTVRLLSPPANPPG